MAKPVFNKPSAEIANVLSGNQWQIGMFEAPCSAPASCCCACLCSCCMVYKQRTEILEITNEPYYPFGGTCFGCAQCSCCKCCGEPVAPSQVPCCLGLESFCCTSLALQINRYLIQTRFAKENTQADDCLVGTAVLLQNLAMCCECIACLWNCYADMSGSSDQKVDAEQCKQCADCMVTLSDLLNCTVLSCMLTQQQVEVNHMKASGQYGGIRPDVFNLLPPGQQKMATGGGGYKPM